MVKLSFITLIVAAFGLLSASAQSGGGLGPDSLVEVDFSVLSFADLPEQLYFREGDDYASVRLTTAAPSASHRYVGPPQMVLVETPPAADEVVKPLVRVSFPPVRGSFLVILFPGAEGRLEARALPNGTEDFPAGSFRFFNLARMRIAGSLGDNRFVIEPFSQAVVAAPVEGRNKITVQLARGSEEEWELVYRSKWAFNAGQRINVFFFPAPRQPSGIRIQRFYELAPPSEPEE